MKTFSKVLFRVGVLVFIIGILLTVIGFIRGGKVYNRSTQYDYNFNESYEGVTSIDIDISYGTLNVLHGDKFEIVAENMNKNTFHSYVDNNTWIIKDDDDDFWSGFHFNLFGDSGSKDSSSPKVTIYIPDDFNAKELELELGAGSAKVEEFSTNKASISVGAGELVIDSITIENKGDISVGAGQIDINNIKAKNVMLDCGAGQITIDGVITGDSEVDCGVGHVDMNLVGNPDEYNYSIECGLGKISLNGKSYGVSSDTKVDNQDATNSFDLNCGVGNINLNINQN